MKFRIGLSIVLSFALVLFEGCATTTETDPLKVNASDLLLGQDRLNQHLAVQKQVLGSLQVRVAKLETQLIVELGKLQRLKKTHAIAGQINTEAGSELSKIEEQCTRAELTLAEIAKSRAELAEKFTEHSQQVAAMTRDQEQQKALQQEVQRLEAEVTTITDSIRRTLRLREEQILREDGR